MLDCELPGNPRLAMMADNDNVRAGTSRPDPEVALTIQDVSRMLQVPAPTIRSWERRYGVPTVGRSHGGHRRYTQEQFTMLRHMRDEISRGYPAVEAAALVKAAQSRSAEPLIATFTDAAHSPRPLGHRAGSRCRPPGPGPRPDHRRGPAAGHAGDRSLVGDRPVRRGPRAPGHPDQPSLAGQDRAISAAVSAARPVLLTCGPRDHHTLGLESMGALLRNRCLDCRLLGARTPAESLAQAVQQIDPAAVIVVSHLSVARRSAIEALRSVPREAWLFHAGNAFLSAPARRGVPGVYLGTNLSQAADVVVDARSLLRRTADVAARGYRGCCLG